MEESALAKPARFAVYTAVGLFVVNVLVAWALVAWATVQVGTSGEQLLTATPERIELLAHVGHVTNGQLLRLATQALAFAMTSAGFALFVMGAQGTFTVDLPASETTKIAMQASAPGLACFLFAMVLSLATLAWPTQLGTPSEGGGTTSAEGGPGPGAPKPDDELDELFGG